MVACVWVQPSQFTTSFRRSNDVIVTSERSIAVKTTFKRRYESTGTAIIKLRLNCHKSQALKGMTGKLRNEAPFETLVYAYKKGLV